MFKKMFSLLVASALTSSHSLPYKRSTKAIHGNKNRWRNIKHLVPICSQKQHRLLKASKQESQNVSQSSRH